MTRVTPEIIDSITTPQIFVFGSNLAGRHGKGAAKTAMRFGAIYGQPEGLHGETYAIPTKDKRIKTLPISEIKKYVDRFAEFAKENKHLTFLVTEIGCGLAGYLSREIAPLFAECIDMENIYLPESFVWCINNPYAFK